MLELKIKLLEDGLPVPRYQHDGDAGLDLPSRIDYTLEPGERARIPTGVAVAIPRGYAGFVLPRSGLAARHGIALVNSPGLIDAGYRGEIVVILLNTDRREPFLIHRGDRIAQLVLQKVIEATTRGDGGFGSTGQA
jgi:dUTP pyrophosphatase